MKCHTEYGMKMTMHIDEKLLDEVIERFGCASKTEAVDFALREVVRKAKLKELGRTGLGLTPDELGNAVYPGYDVISLRAAEAPAKYGKRGSRR
jgi:Arc/MetJ family transcription regulator